jgi:hypothetical protein
MVHWRRADLRTGDPLAEWWSVLDADGLLPKAPRIVLHVPSCLRTSQVVATMQSLIAFLRRGSNATEISVVAPDLDADACGGLAIVSLPDDRVAIVDSPRLFPGTPVADLWFEPIFSITLTGVASDPRYGLAGALVAQSELLKGVRGLDLDRIFEAHRLLAADLTIACGTKASSADTAHDRWWAASTSDVALDTAIARAADIVPATLPVLMHLTRHEAVESSQRNAGDEPPRLIGYAPRRWRSRTVRARIRVAYAAAATSRDVRAAARNLRRIPQFLARRRPSWLAFGKACG